MLLPSEKPQIIVVGDSHMGSLKLAHEAGLVPWPSGAEVEFWGATGPLFRQIKWSRGALHAKGEAKDMVKKVNKKGRTSIAAKDFDFAIFYGARLRTPHFFEQYLEWRESSGGWPSQGALMKAALHFLNSTRSYRDACEFSRAGTPAFFCPSPFVTDGIMDLTRPGKILHTYPSVSSASAADRARLWTALKGAAASDGVTLVPQPEDTVTKGLLTFAKYAREDAVPNKDLGHKSPEFAGRWVQDAIVMISEQCIA